MKKIIISIRKIKAIFEKQKIDIYRNKRALLMFFIFPIMALIYQLISAEDLSSKGVFLAMNVIMPPITCLASTVCEERESGTLRCLVFAGVKPVEYFIGIGLCMGLFHFISVCFSAMIQNDTSISSILLLGVAGSGIVCSLLIGADIGLIAKKQVSVASLSAPISLFLGMAAFLGLANPVVHKFTKYIYTQIIIDVVMRQPLTTNMALILISNIIIFGLLYIFMYGRRKRAD